MPEEESKIIKILKNKKTYLYFFLTLILVFCIFKGVYEKKKADQEKADENRKFVNFSIKEHGLNEDEREERIEGIFFLFDIIFNVKLIVVCLIMFLIFLYIFKRIQYRNHYFYKGNPIPLAKFEEISWETKYDKLLDNKEKILFETRTSEYFKNYFLKIGFYYLLFLIFSFFISFIFLFFLSIIYNFFLRKKNFYQILKNNFYDVFGRHIFFTSSYVVFYLIMIFYTFYRQPLYVIGYEKGYVIEPKIFIDYLFQENKWFERNKKFVARGIIKPKKGDQEQLEIDLEVDTTNENTPYIEIKKSIN